MRRTGRILLGALDKLQAAMFGAQYRENPSTDWWVLAVGDPLDDDDFDQREAARNRLRRQTAAAGLCFVEHEWVWDETNRAQLALDKVTHKDEALQLARDRRALGLTIRIRRGFE